MRRIAIACCVLLALGSALFLLVGRPDAAASSFTVDSTADAVDANPGDGLCATAGGQCTLRAAIQEANASAGGDTIALPAGTYTLSAGELSITDDLRVIGGGAASTITDGGGMAPVFGVAPPAIVDMSGLTIRNGAPSGFGSTGGGISNGGTLPLSNSIITGNTGAYGGAGGIFNDGTLALTNVSVSGNAGEHGGGIANSGTLTAANVSIYGNTATQEGGGLYNGYAGTTTLTNATVSGNVADLVGGGICNKGTLTVANGTMSDNSRTTIISVGTATLKNTIVANATVANCTSCAPAITSAGHNIDSDGTCGLASSGDLSNTDPQIGPLQDNGGPTFTHALLAGSPAIDAGDNTGCPSTDQRGAARPVDGNGDGSAVCDIGAYESEAAAPSTPTPTPTATPTTTATPTPAPTTTPPIASWRHSCYTGPSQPVEQALSGIIGDVLAVYRLSASQSFESWFPGRPVASTITTVRPYEPLFILMAKDAAWSQTPSGTPPTSANLAQGWNSVCYAGTAKAPEGATSGIADEVAILYTLGSNQAWGHYVPGRPEASDIAQLNQYDAVLMLVTKAGSTVWTFDP